MRITDGAMHLDAVRALITEYTTALGRDLTFQHLDEELSDLDSKYLPPNGRLLCAQTDDGSVVGCVAYTRLSDTRCEMKRLYVRPKARGQNVGRALAEAIIAAAKRDGYDEMVLDTLRPLHAAIALYRALGFEETDPYYVNPFEDVIYMKKDL